MSKKLRYFIGILLLVAFVPVRGISQTPDDKADKAERAHRKHLVKHAVNKTRNGINKAYHKAKHAPGNAIRKAKAKHAADEKQEGETN